MGKSTDEEKGEIENIQKVEEQVVGKKIIPGSESDTVVVGTEEERKDINDSGEMDPVKDGQVEPAVDDNTTAGATGLSSFPVGLFPEEKHDGVCAMMISMKNMEKYELKTGEGLKDTLLYKWFDKEEILEEIREVGFYSDFNEFKKDIIAYTGEKILVIADHEELYGQNWMICITEEGAEYMLGIIEAETRRKEEERQRLEEEEIQRLAEEEAARNVVYEDKPVIPGPRTSGTEPETQEEIEWSDIRPTRKLMILEIGRKRCEFGAPIKFSDRDTEQSGLVEFRQHKDPNFELKRKQIDIGLQACPSWTAIWLPESPWCVNENNTAVDPVFDVTIASTGTAGKKNMSTGVFDFCAEILSEKDILYARELPKFVDGESQTPFFRKLNGSTQYEYIDLPEDDIEEKEDRNLNTFLKDVLPTVEFALQQNETLDVFANEFLSLRSEEVSGLGNKEDNYLKELRTFTDLVYSNGKLLSCVDWHPRLPNVVAVSCNEPLKFDQRVAHSGKEKNSFILIWNFADLIHPQLVLQSPHECTHFKFNPDQPHLIAGGCVSGQVVLWDISSAQDQLKRRKDGSQEKENGDQKSGNNNNSNNNNNSGSGNNNDNDNVSSNDTNVSNDISTGDSKTNNATNNNNNNNNTITPIQPLTISTIDQSHKRPVSHLEWLPNELHVNSSGQVRPSQGKPGTADRVSYQFVTCAGDGRVMFWDSRFNLIAQQKQQQRGKPADSNEDNNSSGSGNNNASAGETQWTPLYKCTISKSEGNGEIELSKISLRGRFDMFYEQIFPRNQKKMVSDESVREGLVSGTMFSCTTEDGEMLFGDWSGAVKLRKLFDEKAKKTIIAGSSEKEAKENASRTLDDKLIWVARDHFRDCITLRRSPFFKFLLLSVSPNGFNIWKEDLDRPLFSSPVATGMSHLTCAEWSPTRPGVIIVGKSDGAVDIWDLTDQSHRPSATIPIAAYAITSMQFRNDLTSYNASKHQQQQQQQQANRLLRKRKQIKDKHDLRAIRALQVEEATITAPQGDHVQLLALGDATGNLHILDIPRNLRWRMPKEEKIVGNFIERELERVAYVMKRAVIREKQRQALTYNPMAPTDVAQTSSPPLSTANTSVDNTSNNNNNNTISNTTTMPHHHQQQQQQTFIEDSTLDRDSKEYKKLVEAEEKRYQALAAKLSEDLGFNSQ